jgi:hypothetical protein
MFSALGLYFANKIRVSSLIIEKYLQGLSDK